MNKKNKFFSIALSAILAVGMVSALASCGDNNTKDPEKENNGTTKSVVSLSGKAPTCFIESDYTDSSITETSFTVKYNSSYSGKVAATVENASLADVSLSGTTTVDGVVYDTYSVKSKGTVGETDVVFKDGDTTLGKTTVEVKAPYPTDDYKSFGGAHYSHDPTIIEVPEGYTADGETYYYFSYSTDNEAGYGVPVRASKDMINWDQLTSMAIPGFGKDANAVQKNCEAGTSELQEVYDVLSAYSKFSVWTLWAPEVVRADNGKYYLYGSWTDAFGSRRSVIFMCSSDSPAGPFEYQGIIVYSPNRTNDSKQSNAIDPSVFCDTDGKMYMSYGSFSDFRVIELDPSTGLRKDGATFTVDEMTSSNSFYTEKMTAEEYFGTKILSNTNIEGSVIEYFADVPVYSGDIASYSDDKLTYVSNYYLMGSANSLSSNYNMRVFKSSTALGTYTSAYGGSAGTMISGNFTWASEEEDTTASIYLNHLAPGHNDLITTSRGENFIAYHNKVSGGEGSIGDQYLSMGLIAFNSNGDLVMSPNRYNGESLRKITEDEITKVSDGNYLGVQLSSNTLGAFYYGEEYQFNADGTISGAYDGTWTLYGDNYIYIVMNGCEYYGVVMPGWCTQYDETNAKKGYKGNGGLVISALGLKGKEQKVLYMEMYFGS